MLDALEEVDHVAANPAPEAVVQTLGGGDVKAGTALLVEGAKPLETAPAGGSQGDVITHHLGDPGGIADPRDVVGADAASHGRESRCRVPPARCTGRVVAGIMVDVDLQIIDAAGSAREIGRAHGEQAREAIARGLERWRDQLALTGVDADSLWKDLSRGSGFRDATARWAPHLLDEVEGIAEGANADPDAVFATNCLDEAWWWGKQGSGCSAVALIDSGQRPIIGQNMDLDTWMDTTQVALRLQPSEGPAQVLLSRAGMVGLCGANEAGVGVVVNTLDTLPSTTDGLPVAFVIRLLAEQTSVDAVEPALRSVRHASGQAYTVASADGAVAGYEAGGDHVASYVNDGDRPGARWHTNHPLAGSYGAAVGGDDWAGASTLPRLERVTAAMETMASTDDLKAVLADADAGVCMYPGRWRDDGFTFGSVVMELGSPPSVQIAPGPPDRTPYVDVPFA